MMVLPLSSALLPSRNLVTTEKGEYWKVLAPGKYRLNIYNYIDTNIYNIYEYIQMYIVTKYCLIKDKIRVAKTYRPVSDNFSDANFWAKHANNYVSSIWCFLNTLLLEPVHWY